MREIIKALSLCLLLTPIASNAATLDDKLSRLGGPSIADFVQYQDQPKMQAYVLAYARAIGDVNFLQLLPLGDTRAPFLCVPSDKLSDPGSQPFGTNFSKEAILSWVSSELQRKAPVHNRLLGKDIKPLQQSDSLQTAVLLAVTNHYPCIDNH